MSEIGSISVSINGDASGLLSAVSSAQSAVNSLNAAVGSLKSSNVSVTLNAQDNATPIVNAAKSSVTDFGNLKSQATVLALDNTAAGVASATAAVNSIPDRVVTVTVRVNQEGSIPNFAGGTRSAPPGLARINDEKGVRDPRELIYHRGSYYLFEGRDVLLPLDRGDTVFTAKQTKNIMRLAGIPSYASGKNNDPFELDKRIFKNRTKTSNMPVSEQLEWWNEAAEKYAYDSEAVMECSEEIFSLTKKLVKELNGVSEVYVDERSKLNDWSSFGDSAIEAFDRIRSRNAQYLNDGIITWDDYCKTLGNIGENMYDERIKHSENWLKQQYKYNDLSVEDYIAGLDRMAQYTQEYYENGLIGGVTYFYGMQSIGNEKADMQKKADAAKYKAWQNSASGYKKQRELYGDWDKYGDSLIKYYDRCIERQKEFFADGTIDWDTYNNAVINYTMERYKAEKSAAEGAYGSLISYAKDYISDVKQAFKMQKSELDYEYKLEKLNGEFSDAAVLKARYKGAVTQKGMDVYSDADKKLRELEFERDKLELEREQSETVAELERQYKDIEENKSLIIERIKDGGINIGDILSSVEAQVSVGQNNICSLLSDLISAVKSSGGGTVYGATTYNITGADSSFIGPILKRSAAAIAG